MAERQPCARIAVSRTHRCARAALSPPDLEHDAKNRLVRQTSKTIGGACGREVEEINPPSGTTIYKNWVAQVAGASSGRGCRPGGLSARPPGCPQRGGAPVRAPGFFPTVPAVRGGLRKLQGAGLISMRQVWLLIPAFGVGRVA